MMWKRKFQAEERSNRNPWDRNIFGLFEEPKTEERKWKKWLVKFLTSKYWVDRVSTVNHHIPAKYD